MVFRHISSLFINNKINKNENENNTSKKSCSLGFARAAMNITGYGISVDRGWPITQRPTAQRQHRGQHQHKTPLGSQVEIIYFNCQRRWLKLWYFSQVLLRRFYLKSAWNGRYAYVIGWRIWTRKSLATENSEEDLSQHEQTETSRSITSYSQKRNFPRNKTQCNKE